APLERVKLIFQTQHELVRINRLHRPLGLYDIYSQAVAREGLSSLWRGTTTSFLRHFTNQAVSSFVVRGPIRNKVLTYPFQHPNGLLAWTLRTLTLGWVPVLFTMVAMTPFDVIHTRLVCDLADASVDGRSKGWRKYESAWDVVQQTLKNEGISGLFNGCTSYVLGIPFYRFLYFALHDAAANIQLHPDMIKTRLLLNLGVTIAAGWLSYPFDTVRQRIIIAASANDPSLKYRSTLHAFAQIIQTEGISALFQGGATNILRSIIASYSIVVLDNVLHKLLSRGRTRKTPEDGRKAVGRVIFFNGCGDCLKG
ncbi:mitochondrial carrier domain-containing protein, partial [Mortierella sp. GBAus27b]